MTTALYDSQKGKISDNTVFCEDYPTLTSAMADFDAECAKYKSMTFDAQNPPEYFTKGETPEKVIITLELVDMLAGGGYDVITKVQSTTIKIHAI